MVWIFPTQIEENFLESWCIVEKKKNFLLQHIEDDEYSSTQEENILKRIIFRYILFFIYIYLYHIKN